MTTARRIAALLTVGLLAAACGSSDDAADPGTADPTPVTAADTSPSTEVGPDCAGFPEGSTVPVVVGAEVAPQGDGTATYRATVCSPYDTPERYADAWRVIEGSTGDEVVVVRELAHDHANEQPFTRSVTGPLPDGVTTLRFEARDLAGGWSGQTYRLDLPDS